MKTPLCDQETTISIMRGEKAARIFCSDYTIMKKLDELTEKTDQYQLLKVEHCGGDVTGKTYRVEDKALISFRAGRNRRTLTEEQRKKAAERLNSARAARKRETGTTD